MWLYCKPIWKFWPGLRFLIQEIFIGTNGDTLSIFWFWGWNVWYWNRIGDKVKKCYPNQNIRKWQFCTFVWVRGKWTVSKVNGKRTSGTIRRTIQFDRPLSTSWAVHYCSRPSIFSSTLGIHRVLSTNILKANV